MTPAIIMLLRWKNLKIASIETVGRKTSSKQSLHPSSVDIQDFGTTSNCHPHTKYQYYSMPITLAH